MAAPGMQGMVRPGQLLFPLLAFLILQPPLSLCATTPLTITWSSVSVLFCPSPLASVFSGTRVSARSNHGPCPHTNKTTSVGAGLIRSYLGAPMQQGGQMQVPGVQMQGMQPGMMGQQQGPRSSE